MGQVKMSERVDAAPAEAWAVMADLSRLGDWLTLHAGWRSDVPVLATGVELVAIVAAKGVRNKITWVVGELDPPHRLCLDGHGVGGTEVVLDMALRSDGAGSIFEVEIDFAHPTLKGPLGSLAARTVRTELTRSLERFRELV